ncbi:MAG: response regulator [Candidatus Omnitrophica bacterium]|jgi:two-component system response regulator MprA|nr:response regulator [Candidatus Omnitrophota bacterium]
MMPAGNILLVDDDEEICDEIGGLLKDEGFSVTVAYDGISAVNLIEKKKFDLMILDLKVPKIGGMDILRHVKAKGLTARVLVVTGRPVKTDPGQSQDAASIPEDPEQDELFEKADGFVSKPFDVEILLARIKSLI